MILGYFKVVNWLGEGHIYTIVPALVWWALRGKDLEELCFRY